MKVNVIAIGKLKEDYLVAACKEYLKRLTRFADVKVVELGEAPPSKTAAEQVGIESEELMKSAKGYIVALDMRGEQMSSEQFATFFKERATRGESEISFLIGGSNGLDESVRRDADKVLSFSKATFPHQLFRVMLLEQVYRAFSINAGAKYHK